jgi:hypothetical protein
VAERSRAIDSFASLPTEARAGSIERPPATAAIAAEGSGSAGGTTAGGLAEAATIGVAAATD